MIELLLLVPKAQKNLWTKLPLGWMDLMFSVVLLSLQGMCTSQTSTSPPCCPGRCRSPPWPAPSLTWVWASGTAVWTHRARHLFSIPVESIYYAPVTCRLQLEMTRPPLTTWGASDFMSQVSLRVLHLRGWFRRTTHYLLKTLFYSII